MRGQLPRSTIRYLASGKDDQLRPTSCSEAHDLAIIIFTQRTVRFETDQIETEEKRGRVVRTVYTFLVSR